MIFDYGIEGDVYMNVWKKPFEKELEKEQENMQKDLKFPVMPKKDGNKPEARQKPPKEADIKY